MSLAALDIEGPWTFQLRNPKNPSQLKTHAGVLEFIAEEGIVHLPAWVSQLPVPRGGVVELIRLDDENAQSERRRSSPVEWCGATEGKDGQDPSPIDRFPPGL